MKTKPVILVAIFALIPLPTLRAEEAKKPEAPKGGEVTRKEEVKPYKPSICMVSGEKLGEMGEPFVFVHEGQEIKLCCKSCKKKFDKEPAKYLKKLAEAK